MAEKLLEELSKCSKKCKDNLGTFLNKLFEPKQQERTEKKEEEEKLSQIFNKSTSLFSLNKAREISKGQRNQKLLIDHQFNYGEITFHSLFHIFQKVREIREEKIQEIFYDLGSGSGKVVFGAALCYPFHKCIGIQYLESLYEISLQLKRKVEESKDQIQKQTHQINQQTLLFTFPHLDFLNQDFKNTNWSDGTVIFVSSTCYSRQVMNQIGNLCSRLQKGTIVITMTRKLENPQMKNIYSFMGTTSWGTCNIFIHIKQS